MKLSNDPVALGIAFFRVSGYAVATQMRCATAFARGALQFAVLSAGPPAIRRDDATPPCAGTRTAPAQRTRPARSPRPAPAAKVPEPMPRLVAAHGAEPAEDAPAPQAPSTAAE